MHLWTNPTEWLRISDTFDLRAAIPFWGSSPIYPEELEYILYFYTSYMLECANVLQKIKMCLRPFVLIQLSHRNGAGVKRRVTNIPGTTGCAYANVYFILRFLFSVTSE